MHQIYWAFDKYTSNLNISLQLSLISHLNIEPPDNTATKLQMNSDQSEIWFSAIYSPNLLSVWQIHFEFEHFIATVPISVILISNYQITLQLNFKLSVINLKFEFNAINAPNLLSVWQIHFEFEHFIATVPHQSS